MFYDLELVDMSDAVENFKFNRIEQKDLNKIKDNFKDNDAFLEFESEEGYVLLERRGFRGVMYKEHISSPKTVAQENEEDSVEISKVSLKKRVIKGD